MSSAPIAIPDSVKKSPNDYVSYHQLNPDGTEKEYEGAACYAAIMASLTKIAVRCRAKVKDSLSVDKDHYLTWMKLCKRHRLVPRKAIYYSEDGKNFLEIPAGVYDKHIVYSALCCYRFSESFAPMVWQIVEHSEKLDGVTFWQLLHYGLSNHYTYGAGHSFSMVYTGSTGMYGKNERCDLAQSIALKVFYRRTIRDRKTITGYTNQTISALAQTLGGSQPADKATVEKFKAQQDDARKIYGYLPGYLTSPPATDPVLKIENFEDLLTTKWTPLFLLRKPNSVQLRKLYKEAST